MLFQNYGLHWHIDRVKWGRPGKGHAGTLSGYRTETDGEVDFREQRGVYVLYDAGFNLLYAGQAGYGNQRLYQRLHQHRFDALGERWSRFSWFGIDPVAGRAGRRRLLETEPSVNDVGVILNHLEAILIASVEPSLNRQGGKFGDALQYHQWYEEAEDAVLGKLAEIENKINALERFAKQ